MAIKIITTSKASDYMYSDIHLDIQPSLKNASGNVGNSTVSGNDIRVSYDLSAIKNSINNLFNTRPGEVVLYPKYGLPLYKYIGEPITTNTAENIGAELEDALIRWEPRIKVNAIYIQPVPDKTLFHIVLDMSVPNIKKDITLGGTIIAPTMQLYLES